MSSETEPIGERIVFKQGPLEKVEKFYLGHHPNLGRLHQGWRGEETVRTVTRLEASRIITFE